MPTNTYDYFLYPIGGDTSSNAAELLQGLKLEALEAERIWLVFGPKKKLLVWPVTIEAMNHVHRTKSYDRRVHYEFYRKNRATGAVTLAPRDMFSSARSSPAFKKMRRDLARHQARTAAVLSAVAGTKTVAKT